MTVAAPWKGPSGGLPAMCGRFTRYLPCSEIVRLYRLTLDYEIDKNTAPAFNIAPTVDVPFVTASEHGNHKLRRGAGGWCRGEQKRCRKRRCSILASKR
jgi:putative SOS response-associated peptidase YedK